MTSVQSWRCDHLATATPTTTPSGLYMSSGTVRDRIECCAISRAAATATTLQVITGRDGWQQLPDGTHLCPVPARPAAARGGLRSVRARRLPGG